MLLLLALPALAADLELELTSPAGAPVSVVFADVVPGPLPSVTVPATADVAAHRFAFALDRLGEGTYRLDIRIEEVKPLGGGRERFNLVASPRVSFDAGEDAQVEFGSRAAGGEQVVTYRVIANIVE